MTRKNNKPLRKRKVSGDAPAEPKPSQQKQAANMSLAARQELSAKRKETFLKYFESHLGIVTFAAKDAGITSRLVYLWLDKDPEFRDKFNAIKDMQVDFVERKLVEHINDGNLEAIKFFLSKKGQRNGFANTSEVRLGNPVGETFNSEVKNIPARKEFSDEAMRAAVKAVLSDNQ